VRQAHARQYALASPCFPHLGLKLQGNASRRHGEAVYDLIDERITSSSCRWFGQNRELAQKPEGRIVTLE